MNGTQFIGMLKSMDNLTSLTQEGKNGIRYQFIRHTGGWDVWTMVGQDNIAVHKFDTVEDETSLIVFYNRGVYIGALTKGELGVEY